jgi:hypothetical protein
MDVRKFFSPADNLSVLSHNYYLVAERTAYPKVTDSIQLILSSTGQQGYRLDFEPTNLQLLKLKPYLFDRYLKTYHPIAVSGTTRVAFNINADQGSRAIDRFKIVFKKSVKKDLELIITKAERGTDRTISINWSAMNEEDIVKYEVERSADGILFTGIITTDANKNADSLSLYTKTDISPLATENYYRIKATRNDGVLLFSNVVKVEAVRDEALVAGEGSISVYPNPVAGKLMKLEFKNQPVGKYQLQLINQLGQVLQRSSVLIQTQNQKQTIQLGSAILPGQYQLSIIAPGGNKTQQTVFVE